MTTRVTFQQTAADVEKQGLEGVLNQSIDKHPVFLIWDGDGDLPQGGEWIPILWRSYGDGVKQLYSLPALVDERADALRERYLAWIYDMGESRIQGQRLIDHLELRPGFSYWWMTLVAKKSSIWESLYINDVLKLLALEELVLAHSVSAIILVSGNKILAQTFRLWCQNAGMSLECRPLSGRMKPESAIKRIYHLLPYPVRAGIYLAHYIGQRWPLRQKNEQQNKADKGTTMFVDYLIHLDQNALAMGRFASNFWTELVSAVGSSESKVNWLHHYIQHEAVPSTRQARDLITRFNQNGAGLQFHASLDGALCLSVLLATLIDYGRLAWKSLSLSDVRRKFRPTGSRFDFWPLFKQDWLNSLRGPAAIWNCLCLNLLTRTLGSLPRQKWGVYLQENQEWEMAFIHTWRAAGHGCLIGVPHGPVRHWDLRYFFDRRSYQRTEKNDVLLPDKVALNGPACLAAYRKGGYPEEQLVEVEALRYLYLADRSHVKTGVHNPLTGPLRVLILGDYVPAITHQQMQWLVEAAPLLPGDTIYVVKPHPNCPIKTNDYPSLQFLVKNAPLKELLADCNVAYASSITTAAVDAYCDGLPVVSVLDGESLNMSPLRGMAGVTHVTNPRELAQALLAAPEAGRRAAVQPYFCLDKGLPRWRKLLGLGPADTRGSADK